MRGPTMGLALGSALGLIAFVRGASPHRYPERTARS